MTIIKPILYQYGEKYVIIIVLIVVKAEAYKNTEEKALALTSRIMKT